MTCLFERIDDHTVLPTQQAVGPWSPESLHGGPVAALAGGAIEAFPLPDSSSGMHVARVTVELLRPVPVRPLTVTARLVRPGRKAQLVECEVADGDTVVARALGLRIRTADVPVPDAVAESATIALPEGPDAPPRAWGWDAYHNTGVAMRFTRGTFADAGPSTVWIRLLCPVVGDEPITPLQRALGAADFGNGVSAPATFDTHTFINPDLTVHLHRPAEGEWVCLDAHTTFAPHGVGLAHSTLHDERGPIGHALQSLLVEAR